MNHSTFLIRNDFASTLTLNIEPEGVCYALPRGDEVTVLDAFSIRPVTIKLGAAENGDPILSIWPGDGDVRVEKNGVDVFELIQASDEKRMLERSVA